jgi:hypothetical protein
VFQSQIQDMHSDRLHGIRIWIHSHLVRICIVHTRLLAILQRRRFFSSSTFIKYRDKVGSTLRTQYFEDHKGFVQYSSDSKDNASTIASSKRAAVIVVRKRIEKKRRQEN